MSDFILASQSPRRRELLSQLGYQFNCMPADIDECILDDELPTNYVQRLAKQKALYIAKNQLDTTIVLGSDTCVVSHEQILGKPSTLEECIRYLTLLQGSSHQVHTSVAVVQGALIESVVVSTQVEFRPITEHEMVNYWRTGEPRDKAGSYGVQGIGGQFVKRIEGSYTAVVGLPLLETTQLLTKFGVVNTLQRTEKTNV